MVYNLVIHKNEGSAYGVTVPDLPGCYSAGDSLEEALAGAKEAIECHLEGLLLDGGDIPARIDLEAYLSELNEPYQLGSVDIDSDFISGEKERVNISASKPLLRLIDRAASAKGKTRSAFLVEAALEEARRAGVERISN